VKYLNLSLRLFNLLNRLKETIKIDGTKIGEERLNIEEELMYICTFLINLVIFFDNGGKNFLNEN